MEELYQLTSHDVTPIHRQISTNWSLPNTEFVSRVSLISTTMAELVTEVEKALQMTKKI